MFGLGLGRLGAVGGGSAPYTPNRVSGASFTANQIEAGMSGSYNITSNTNRIVFAAPGTATLHGGSLLNLRVKGTGATLLFNRVSGSGALGLCQVSVDGGNYTDAAVSTNTYTLFSGLTDTVHEVVVKIGAAYGDANVYLDRLAGSVLQITGGTDTYIELPSEWVYSGVSNAGFIESGMTVANTANFTPAKSKYSTSGSNIGALVFRGNFTKIYASLAGANTFDAFVSVDGGAPTKYPYPLASNAGHVIPIAASSGLHTYYVWTSVKGAIFAATGDGVLSSIANGNRMHQFGDSITEGTSVRGDVELFRVAASLGYAGMTVGIAGYTIAQLNALLDTYFTTTTVLPGDVAILAIGRNNVSGNDDPLDAAEITDYTACVNKLVAAGYAKVLCRGILPSGNGLTKWTAANASIDAIVGGLSNPDVIFVDTSGYPTYTTTSGDNTHPDAAGYTTLAPFVEASYRTALGL